MKTAAARTDYRENTAAKDQGSIDLAGLAALSSLPLTVKLSEKIMAGLQAAIYRGKPFNSFEPFNEPQVLDLPDGRHMVTEVQYGSRFMNSYLDITYPDADTSVLRPTVFYTHGGGFFGGSKSMKDPMAVGEGTNPVLKAMSDVGFNLVNVDYVLTPEGHFPDQLMQLVEAVDFCAANAEQYGLDMSRVVISGSSAGAILTGQYGALLANAAYREALDIYPAIDPDAVKCLVLDDAPFHIREASWALKVMMINFFRTMDFTGEPARYCDAEAYFTEKMKPCFLDAGPKDGFPEDMRACSEHLSALGVPNELYIPTENLPHGFLNLARENEEAAEGVRRIVAFMKKYAM